MPWILGSVIKQKYLAVTVTIRHMFRLPLPRVAAIKLLAFFYLDCWLLRQKAATAVVYAVTCHHRQRRLRPLDAGLVG